VHERALRASPLEFVEEAAVDGDITAVQAHYPEQGGEFLVGESDSRIVAVGGYLPQDEQTAELRRLRVDPGFQRHGFGQQLLDELEARARGEE